MDCNFKSIKLYGSLLEKKRLDNLLKVEKEKRKGEVVMACPAGITNPSPRTGARYLIVDSNL